MLDKYEHFFKINACSQCTLYSAFNRITAQDVILKKVKGKLQWNELLTHRQLALLNKQKVFPKLHQIFKHKGSFFFVLEKPQGHSMGLNFQVDQVTLQTSIPLIADLLQGIQELLKVVPNAVIFPEWVYFHRNSLRILHFEPFLEPEDRQKKYTVPHQVQQPEQELQTQQIVPEQFRKSTVFHLGLLIYRLLTGKKEQNITSQEKYYAYIASVRQHGQRQIQRATQDPKLASFVIKLISSNKFEVPTFQQLYNYYQHQVRQQRNLKAFHKDYVLEVQMEKINISTGKPQEDPFRKIRNCCKIQPQVKSIKKEQFKKMGLVSAEQIATAKKSKLILPYLSIKNSGHKRNNTTFINRHRPQLMQPQSTTNRHARSINITRFKTEGDSQI